jgi:hypothetical protein
MTDALSPRQFQGPPVEGLNLSQAEAVARFQNTRSVSVGGEVVKVSNGLRNQAREFTHARDLRRWGVTGEPGVKAEAIENAAHKYDLVGPHQSLGDVVTRAYGGPERKGG